MENVDAAKVATGKVFAAFRILGIVRMFCGAGVMRGERVSPNAAGKVINSAASSIPINIALSTTTASDQ